eukprot:TRINITY_DN20101_c0_g1_i2.p1 TRINITY_DN20101_c0_g1~~TRINITY_DN20101_c0_g1_i2.p1  ORF type:complete len:634 (+),score=101.51 TRINITY_DN20101_c0_g1_i2:112-2013(+)
MRSGKLEAFNTLFDSFEAIEQRMKLLVEAQELNTTKLQTCLKQFPGVARSDLRLSDHSATCNTQRLLTTADDTEETCKQGKSDSAVRPSSILDPVPPALTHAWTLPDEKNLPGSLPQDPLDRTSDTLESAVKVHEQDDARPSQGSAWETSESSETFSEQSADDIRTSLPSAVEMPRRHSVGATEVLKNLSKDLKRATTQRNLQIQATTQNKRVLRMRKIVVEATTSRWFDAFTAMLIMVCAVLVGVEADWTMQNPNDAPPAVFQTLNRIFAFLFLVELLMRIAAEGLYFISCLNPSVNWNILDSLLVSFSIAEEIIGSVFAFADVLRLIRLLRLVRVFRIIRAVRFFSDLRVMVNGMLNSAKSLLWALVVILMITFIFSVSVMQAAQSLLVGVTPLASEESMRLASSAEQSAYVTSLAVQKYYGSLPRAMCTLFMAISGGIDWSDASEPLNDFSGMMDYIFAGYIFFTVFCCLNIVTGIFVDSAKDLRQQDEESMAADAMSERKRWAKEVVRLFGRVAQDEQGGLNFEEFQEGVADEKVRNLFRNLGINIEIYTPREMFELFDFDESGTLNLDEFAAGMQRLRGGARSIDILKLKRDSKVLALKVQKLMDICSAFSEQQQQHKIPGNNSRNSM